MPIPMRTTANLPTPNTIYYDLHISTRIVDGKLKASIAVTLKPCRCETVDGAEVYSPVFPDLEGFPIPEGISKHYQIEDLEVFLAENLTIAPDVLVAWEKLSAVVHAINQKENLL